LPLSLNYTLWRLHRWTPLASDKPFAIDGDVVDERYLGTMQLGLLAGRNIEPADRDESRKSR